jgi:hypothetical protein
MTTMLGLDISKHTLKLKPGHKFDLLKFKLLRSPPHLLVSDFQSDFNSQEIVTRPYGHNTFEDDFCTRAWQTSNQNNVSNNI